MRSKILIPSLLLALLVGALLTFANSKDTPKPKPSPTQALAAFYTQVPVWSECGGGFECAEIEVPLDYAAPDAKRITITINRLPASNPSRRIGSLLVNPGGPGGSGLEYARGADQVVSESVLKRFDLVGFDPRGVGQSTPIRCLSDREEDQLSAMDQSPDDRFEMEALVFASKLLGQRCKEAAGDSLAFIGSTEVARDMDIIRGVLGDKKLFYIGKSYGTYLGTLYAQIFPKRVGRLVLDGALDPTVDETEAARVQAIGFQGALKAFARNCVSEPGCRLGKSTNEVLSRINGFIEQLDVTPLKTDSRRPLTQSLGVLGVVSALYDQDFGWPELEDALTTAFNGDGTDLLILADQYLNRDERGRFLDNANDISYIVGCRDRRGHVSISISKANREAFSKVSPTFGPYLAYSMLPCEYWPVGPRPYPLPINARGAAPILVVGTLRDPATPYVWAQRLARELSSGRLLTWDGDGHTAYARGSKCIDQSVDSYLLTGVLPEAGKVCR